MLYIGALFIFMVMYAPMGIAGLIMRHEPYWRTGLMRRLWLPYLRTGIPIVITLGGAVAIVETLAWLTIGKAQGRSLHLYWMHLAGPSDQGVPVLVWLVSIACLLFGGILTWHEGKRTARILEELDRTLKPEDAP
jgi:branched-chain amino acid transport system permease protein